MTEQPPRIDVRDLGRMAFGPCLKLQRSMRDERIAARESGLDHPETLLLVEHDPVYTWGRRTDPAHLGAGPVSLRALGAEAIEIERGGEVTFHGPGQIVAYPIAYLGNLSCGRDLHRYVRLLEEVVIATLARFGLVGEREEGLTGVWVRPRRGGEREKVAAIGVHTRKWVTLHGLALNVNTDLSWFDAITPCGIEGRRVTSMEKLTGKPVNLADVADTLGHEFKRLARRSGR